MEYKIVKSRDEYIKDQITFDHYQLKGGDILQKTPFSDCN